MKAVLSWWWWRQNHPFVNRVSIDETSRMFHHFDESWRHQHHKFLLVTSSTRQIVEVEEVEEKSRLIRREVASRNSSNFYDDVINNYDVLMMSQMTSSLTSSGETRWRWRWCKERWRHKRVFFEVDDVWHKKDDEEFVVMTSSVQDVHSSVTDQLQDGKDEELVEEVVRYIALFCWSEEDTKRWWHDIKLMKIWDAWKSVNDVINID